MENLKKTWKYRQKKGKFKKKIKNSNRSTKGRKTIRKNIKIWEKIEKKLAKKIIEIFDSKILILRKNKNQKVSLKWFQGLKSITWQNKFKHVWKTTTVIQNGRQGNMSYQFGIYFKGSAGLWLKRKYNQNRSLCEHYCKNYVYFTKKPC